MKKSWMILGVAVLLAGTIAVALAGATLVSAQAPTPAPQGPISCLGRGGQMAGTGQMHVYMRAALAEKLGMTVDDLTAQEEAGKTICQVLEEKGYTAEEIVTLMHDARAAALDQMVADGIISQAQADAMKSNGARMMGGNRMRRNGCTMLGGMFDQMRGGGRRGR